MASKGKLDDEVSTLFFFFLFLFLPTRTGTTAPGLARESRVTRLAPTSNLAVRGRRLDGESLVAAAPPFYLPKRQVERPSRSA